jgi:hypothetical protein
MGLNVRELAEGSRTYYHELRKQGFSKRQALEMTKLYQNRYFDRFK